VLELLKPITWFPPMWAFLCGAVSAGQAFTGHGVAVFFGVLLAGPLVCATSQAVNDWYDREVDAINEPQRPIPSGRIPGKWGLYIGLIWTMLSVIVAGALGPVVLAAASIGLLLAWAYSAPPVRLKLNGWWGNAAVGLCYEGLPWITGAAILSVSGIPDSRIFAVALLYSIGAHGIMVLNDFKAIEGDRQLGVRSLPVQLGAARAARVACLFMAGAQAAVVVLLLTWQRPLFALAIAVLIGIQALLMRRLLSAPRELAPWYNATGVSLYVLGMMVTAIALRYPL
jgi:chlorophyll synthase